MSGASDEARTEILRRIREAGADTMPVSTPKRDYELKLPESIDRVALFAERIADYRAEVGHVTRAGLAEAIATSLRGRGARHVAVARDIDRSWLASSDAEVVSDDPPLTHRQLDSIDGVVTACSVGVAETGTIVLDGGIGQGRRALSLLPDYHLCIVTADQIVGTVPEAFDRLDAQRPQTWISGPSATSDIELERVEGVHGPRTLHVLIVKD